MGFRDAFPLRDAFPSAVTPLHSTGLHRIYTQNIWVCTATTFHRAPHNGYGNAQRNLVDPFYDYVMHPPFIYA